MKLSEKGKENLQGFGFAHNCDGAMALLDDYDFEPDDFEGGCCQNGNDQSNQAVKKVELTVEEAKEIADKLKDLSDGFFLQTGNVDMQAIESMTDLIIKIEQSEMSMQSTQCENVSKKDEKIIILTVEEAKAIAFDLKFLKSFVQFCPSEVKERIAQFESRIEQAEGK